MGITREEIKNLLKAAIAEPLERKLDNMNNGFQELKRLVDCVNGKYDDVLVQLKQADEKIQRQGMSLREKHTKPSINSRAAFPHVQTSLELESLL